jgi:hypothetical protein
MDFLRYVGTKDTPEIELNRTNGQMRVTGNSYPANAVEFYAPIIDYYREHMKFGQLERIKIEFYLFYLNTSSTKVLMEFFNLLEEYYLKAYKVSVVWYYDQGDSSIYSIGEDFRNAVSFPLQLVAKAD